MVFRTVMIFSFLTGSKRCSKLRSVLSTDEWEGGEISGWGAPAERVPPSRADRIPGGKATYFFILGLFRYLTKKRLYFEDVQCVKRVKWRGGLSFLFWGEGGCQRGQPRDNCLHHFYLLEKEGIGFGGGEGAFVHNQVLLNPLVQYTSTYCMGSKSLHWLEVVVVLYIFKNLQEKFYSSLKLLKRSLRT